MERTTLHIVCGNSRSRAEQARTALALGHHAEVYAGLDELLERPAAEGIVIACDNEGRGTPREIIERLTENGMWLPVVFTAPAPAPERVVAAMKAGAIDYMQLPMDMGTFAGRLQAIIAEAVQQTERRQRMVKAQAAIGMLSPRERQVLELLSGGCSNKEIARALGISPRTVEIHRGNMMTKLGAGHAADAVRLWIDAQLEPATIPAGDPRALRDSLNGLSGRIGPREPDRLLARRQRQ